MITSKCFKTRAEWLAYRNDTFKVGGSNIGIILGLSKYVSPRQYWEQIMSGGQDDAPALSRGRYMEDGIAQWFEQESGAKIIKKSSGIWVYTNDKYPDYFQVAPDREVFAHGTGERCGVEIKDTRALVDFDDPLTIPDAWYAQIQYNMGIMERPFWWLVVCDGSKTLKFRKFAFDKTYFEALISQATEWVEKYIKGGEIPPISTKTDALAAFPTSEAGEKETTQEIVDTIAALRLAQKREKEAAEEVKRLQDVVAAQFDERDTLTFCGAAVATFKTQTRRTVDIKAFVADFGAEAEKYIKNSTFRTLKIK